MDLIGLGTDDQGESSQLDSMDFTRTTPQTLMMQVLEQTFKAYSVDEKIPPLEVLNLLD